MKIRSVASALVLLGSGFAALAQKPDPLVVISIDGMKPEYVTHAAEHGLKLPVLRSFLADGTYAEGVVGVVPTVTYPSHTTLVTGVWPAEHGIVDNTTFDPMREHPGQWYWDFSAIKVPTLYTAADAAGLKTAAVGWPVTVGAPIDYLIAEGAQSERTDKPSGPAYRPLDIVQQLGVVKPAGGDEDDVKTLQAEAILEKWKPTLLLLHLTDLDHQEHEHEPFSAEADASLEKIDAQVGAVIKTALKVDPRTRIAIVSDHGFLPVQQRVNLNVLFVKAGLIRLAPEFVGKQKLPKTGGVAGWDAEAWAAGGDNAIVVRNNDPAVIAKVRALLADAAKNPAYGIERVLEHDEIVKRGGFPEAAFLVDYKDGFDPGGSFTGAVVTPAPHTGMHGYLPDRPAMRSTFMIEGQGIARGRDLRVIDMRQIAPTFAKLIDVSLPTAKMSPVDVTR